ncbi:helix-turn-helix domain-containing protein [Nocardioides jejuensis]|uniref:helix-turn-helix domain-containing protein n=1 Tax=Nocardioides jejuensis TaxID=2502782 RepID=UPI0014043A31|nr:PucR family transcriptional regulator [Nocardioides jejuensis]
MSVPRTETAARAQADAAELVDAVVATVFGTIPAYATLDATQVDEVKSIAGWTLRRVLDLWATGTEPNAEDVRRFRNVGGVRARDGRPLPAVLRAYRTVGPHLLDIVSERYGNALSVPDVTALGRTYLSLLDVISEAIQEGYDASTRALLTDRDTSLRLLASDIMRGRQTHEGSLAARLRELDTRLPKSFDVLIVRPDEGATGASQRLADGPVGGDALLQASVDGLNVAMFHQADRSLVGSGLRTTGTCGVLLSGVTTRSAPRLFRISASALHHPASRPDVLFGRSDVEAIAVLTGHPDADGDAFVQDTLGPLLNEPELLRTLEAVLWMGSDIKAAAELGLHPQTIRYRLRSIAASTGRTTRSQWDRFVLHAALTARG